MGMPRIPEKELFHVTEVVWLIAPYLDRDFDAVKRQIYREIEAGKIDARIYLGRKMLRREQVIKLIEGEPA